MVGGKMKGKKKGATMLGAGVRGLASMLGGGSGGGRAGGGNTSITVRFVCCYFYFPCIV